MNSESDQSTSSCLIKLKRKKPAENVWSAAEVFKRFQIGKIIFQLEATHKTHFKFFLKLFNFELFYSFSTVYNIQLVSHARSPAGKGVALLIIYRNLLRSIDLSEAPKKITPTSVLINRSSLSISLLSVPYGQYEAESGGIRRIWSKNGQLLAIKTAIVYPQSVESTLKRLDRLPSNEHN